MMVDKNTPGVAGIRIWFNGKLIGGVVRANTDEGWADVHVVREVADRREYTTEVVRTHGAISLSPP